MSAIDDFFKLEFKLPDESVILEEFEKVKREFERFPLSDEYQRPLSLLMFNELSRRVNKHFKMIITFLPPDEKPLHTGRF
ncbi:hypothetical protein MU985_003152 [Salmonella enterica]|nr:hypothetical protein [Salmonella enterica]EJA5052708.1 hypothetical protein [Salmonella enterica]EJA5147270.1 hypothetical protein [Salmonella enterica]EJA5987993.1 hypothetical protein [Salmonella enterica]EJF5732142.1 hypothetical protein [Salmonella enterica]